jgi:hypothetical protein
MATRTRRKRLPPTTHETSDVRRPSGRGWSAAFRASVEERLRNLEQQVGELKGRVNGLIFLVAGTALTQVIMKILQ